MSQKEVVICNPVRTAIGTYGGSLKDVTAPDLGATVIRESLKRSGLSADKVQTLVMGNVIQAGVKMNPARQAGIGAGLPVSIPALTVNRVCGSGAQGVVSAALEIWAGMIDCAIAGGMENMDRAPYLLPQGRWGARMGDVTMFDSMLCDGLNDAFSGQHSGWHTEDLVTEKKISREDQDRWALRSQQRFAAAQAAGKFDAEIAAVEVPGRKGPTVFSKDEHNRPDTTADAGQAQAGIPQGRHHYRRQRAGPEHGCGRDDCRRSAMGREKWTQTDGAPGVVWCRRGRARHVRPGSGAGGSASARARRLESGGRGSH